MKLLSSAAILLTATLAFAADAPKPLKVLLITGGCCHDYAKQKDILKEGLEARANLVVTQIHTDDKSTNPPLAILNHSDYANGYDLVIHDECAAAISNPDTVAAVLAPHREGIPGVNLHCAMHCYRIGSPNDPITDPAAPHAFWFNYLGLQSSGHGPQEPIAISFVDKDHAITKGLGDWTTIKEELYNNVAILTAHALAKGKQTVTDKKTGEKKEVETVVAWTNEYGPKKTRVFSTTIGHNNETVADARYLDLVTRGVLWACDKLDAAGKPKAGYAK